MRGENSKKSKSCSMYGFNWICHIEKDNFKRMAEDIAHETDRILT